MCGRMVADKHGDAGILEAVNGAIHEMDCSEVASPYQTNDISDAATVALIALLPLTEN